MLGRARGAIVAALIVATAAGCGDGENGDAAGGATPLEPGTGHTMLYALAQDAEQLDPLRAEDRASQIVTRQIHEPLVERLEAPLDEARTERGPARSWRSSADREIWRFELRPRIRFQDGTPFNASAVLANAERWRTLAPGRDLLPELVAVDAPRPDLVRFILSRPVPDLPRRLASPRLGIVSPAALRPRSGRGARVVREDRSGTGAFEFREREAGRIVIARNVAWWGTRLDLGPALDQIEFRVEPEERERIAMLKAGSVQLADSLPLSARGELRSDPLLTFVAGGGDAVLGLERSVRGIESASAIMPLSGVWLTTLRSE